MGDRRWKVIDKTNGMYEVSDDGQVRSHQISPWAILHRRDAVRLRKRVINSGAYYVLLYLPGGFRSVSVSRLVLEAFVGPPPDEHMKPCYLDGDLLNPKLDNLYWGYTHPKHNPILKAVIPNTQESTPERDRRKKLTGEEVTEMRSLRGTMTAKKLAGKYNCSAAYVWEILNYRSRTNG